MPYLSQHYTSNFLDNISMIKTDTEGHDVVILQDLLNFPHFRPPIIWTEWTASYRYTSHKDDVVIVEVDERVQVLSPKSKSQSPEERN